MDRRENISLDIVLQAAVEGKDEMAGKVIPVVEKSKRWNDGIFVFSS